MHKRTSFYVKAGAGVFTCHFCGESGWALKLIERVGRCTINEAIERVMAQRTTIYKDTEYVIVDDPTDTIADDAEDDVELPPIIELPEGFHYLEVSHGETSRRYRNYALTRMTEKQIVEYKVGFVATGPYRGRIIVPVYYLGVLVNWVARAVKDDMKKKVLTPFGNDQYSYLFNLEKIWGHKQVVVTEGVFDCLAMDDMAVATFGKKVTDIQVNALVNAGVRELVLAWDADAQKEIWLNYQRLRMTFDSVTVVSLPDKEDPASLGRDRMVQLIQQAQAPKNFIKTSGGEMPEIERMRV